MDDRAGFPPIKTPQMQRLEHKLGRPLDEYLREQYVERGLRMEDVAASLGVDIGTTSRWMKRLGIKARTGGPSTPTAA